VLFVERGFRVLSCWNGRRVRHCISIGSGVGISAGIISRGRAIEKLVKITATSASIYRGRALAAVGVCVGVYQCHCSEGSNASRESRHVFCGAEGLLVGTIFVAT
jgi:hypothetical protein